MNKNRALRKQRSSLEDIQQSSLQKEIQQNAIYENRALRQERSNCATAKPRLIQYLKRSNLSALALAITFSLPYNLCASDEIKVPYNDAKTKRLQTITNSIEGPCVITRTSWDQHQQFTGILARQKEYAPEIKRLLEENADPAAIRMFDFDHGLPSTLAMDPIILETLLQRGFKPDNTKFNSSLHRLCDYDGLWDNQYLSQTLNIVALLRFFGADVTVQDSLDRTARDVRMYKISHQVGRFDKRLIDHFDKRVAATDAVKRMRKQEVPKARRLLLQTHLLPDICPLIEEFCEELDDVALWDSTCLRVIQQEATKDERYCSVLLAEYKRL